MYNYYSNVQKRKVFISYYHGDQEAVNKFVRDFGDVFIPKTVGVKDGDFDFDMEMIFDMLGQKQHYDMMTATKKY